MWLQEVRIRVIEEYKNFVRHLNVGKEYNYDHILDMINFLEIEETLDNKESIANYFIAL